MKKWLIRGLIASVALVALGVVGFFGYFEALKRGWVRYNEFDIRSEGIVQVGDPAPDLSLRPVDGDTPVPLSSLYRRNPVALVFGSYT